MKSEFTGDILSVRAVEDCIRVTHKYTKGAFTRKVVHPVQDTKTPVKSRVLTEHYEVYPETEISWDMRASDAWALLWGDVVMIDVKFQYDYRSNKSEVTVHGGRAAVSELCSGIPGLEDALALLSCRDSGLVLNAHGRLRKTQETTSGSIGAQR